MENTFELIDRYAERMALKRDKMLKELEGYVARTEKVTKDAGKYRGKVESLLNRELTELKNIPTPMVEETTAVVQIPVRQLVRQSYTEPSVIAGSVPLIMGTMFLISRYLKDQRGQRR